MNTFLVTLNYSDFIFIHFFKDFKDFFVIGQTYNDNIYKIRNLFPKVFEVQSFSSEISK